jgi:hypothetical protein
MMHFLEPRADADLLAELRDAGLLTPETIERIDVRMGRPESGRLDDFLLAGAGDIPAPDWIAWLIRRHGCHRFGPVRWNEALGRGPQIEPVDSPNLPYGMSRDGGLLVAVLRPDLRSALERRRLAPRLLWAAATLRECADLRSAWRSRSAAAP